MARDLGTSSMSLSASPGLLSVSPSSPAVTRPFSSTTDPTLHRRAWRSTRAIEPTPSSPRKPLPRYQGFLRYDLLGPQAVNAPTQCRSRTATASPSPPPVLRPATPVGRCLRTVGNCNAVANNVAANLDELRWLEHRWLDCHGKSSQLKERREQLLLLRRWFDSLDADGSGEVGLTELEDPLVSVGLAHSREDVQQLIDGVGGDGSGGVSFDAFLSLLYPDRVKRVRAPRSKLALHQPKHQSPVRPKTSPGTCEARVLASPLTAKPRRPHRSINIKKPDANPVVRLFQDLQAGKLGDLAIPFPVLITAYRRRMLLDAHMAEDPRAKSAGSVVLQALEANRCGPAHQVPTGASDWRRPSLARGLPSLP